MFRVDLSPCRVKKHVEVGLEVMLPTSRGQLRFRGNLVNLAWYPVEGRLGHFFLRKAIPSIAELLDTYALKRSGTLK